MIGGPSDHAAAAASVERRRGRRGGRGKHGRGEHDMDAYMGVLDEGTLPPPLPASALGASAAGAADGADGPQVERWSAVVEQKDHTGTGAGSPTPFQTQAQRAAASAERLTKAGQRRRQLRSPPGSPLRMPKAGVTSLSPPPGGPAAGPALSISKKLPGHRKPRSGAAAAHVRCRPGRQDSGSHLTGFRALPASPPPLAPALGRVTPLSPWGKPAHGASASSVPMALGGAEYKEGSLEAVVSNRATMVTGAGEDFDRGVARYEGLLR